MDLRTFDKFWQLIGGGTICNGNMLVSFQDVSDIKFSFWVAAVLLSFVFVGCLASVFDSIELLIRHDDRDVNSQIQKFIDLERETFEAFADVLR